MQKTHSSFKVISFVVLGNVLEYYDFLLFMHLGPLITPLFFPGYSSKETHFLSLLLFGLAFVIRPVGGYIFGRISDLQGRKSALVQSVKWAILPAFGLTLLPTYETIGALATYLFVFFRLFQGVALGGEYPNAGTYLMEYYKKNHGFVSGILSASGTIGSLLGFGMALLCSMNVMPDWFWRFGFLFGALAGVLSFRMRMILADITPPIHETPKVAATLLFERIGLVAMCGMLVGTTTWLPMTYSNFYITKTLGFPPELGLWATFIALLGHVLFTPLWGAISDRFARYSFMTLASLMIIPLSLLSFYLMSQGSITMAQVGLIFAASAFGAPIHAVMNSLFPAKTRGRSVALAFMIGLSLGGLAPSLVSIIIDKTGFQYAPAAFLSLIAASTAFLFYRFTKRLTVTTRPVTL